MRPVNRGLTPQINGVDKTVTDYKDWRQDLLDTIGNYCCYCNMVLNDSPQVEHVTPKNPQPGQTAGALLSWGNMLLGCGPCNRAKGNNPNSNVTHYLPDFCNTHMAFDYVILDHPKKKNQKACLPVPNAGINNVKAQNTINLCKLDSLVSNPRATDLRWKYRFEAWYSANSIWRENWDKWGSTKALEFSVLLVDVAKAKGFFSIWFQAFADVPIIKSALIDGFLGTNKSFFQAADPFNPLPTNL